MPVLSRNLQAMQSPAEVNKSPSIINRKTHSTLFNQYSLPDYMLQSPSRLHRINRNRLSNSSLPMFPATSTARKDTPNLDLAHIDENVSLNKSNRKANSKFSSPHKKGKRGKALANSTAGFLAQNDVKTNSPIAPTSGDEDSPSLRPEQLKTQYNEPLLALEQHQYLGVKQYDPPAIQLVDREMQLA